MEQRTCTQRTNVPRLFVLIFISSFAAYISYSKIIAILGAAKAGMVLYLSPIYVAIFAILFAWREHLHGFSHNWLFINYTRIVAYIFKIIFETLIIFNRKNLCQVTWSKGLLPEKYAFKFSSAQPHRISGFFSCTSYMRQHKNIF